MSALDVRFALRSGGGGGALAIIDLQGQRSTSLDNLLKAICGVDIEPGELRLRDLCGVDQAIVARITPNWAQLMCHDGPAVRAGVRDALLSAGAQQASAPNDPRARFPEAQTLLEACMLDALSRAASPLAVDLLLAQPAHWASHPDFDPTSPDAQSRARILNRLIEPPLIVAVGAPNVGKSSLLNALAGRSVALAAAQAGTTRDHVGAILDLGGLVVRWVDTPGCSDVSAPTTDPILAHAQEVASVVIASADLVLHCCDAKQGVRPPVKSAAPVLQIATRCDLAAPTPAGFVLETAAGATPQQGLPSLVQAVQDALVPAAIRKQVVPWAFHPALPTPEKRKAGPV